MEHTPPVSAFSLQTPYRKEALMPKITDAKILVIATHGFEQSELESFSWAYCRA